jgi:hypothetical protein
MVNLHEIFSNPESKLPYMQQEFELTPAIIAIIERKENRNIRMLLHIMLSGNDDRLIKPETYAALLSELQEAISKKLFNTQNFLAQLNTIREKAESW